jgi:hypothetical protein
MHAHADCFGWKYRYSQAATRITGVGAGLVRLAPLRHHRLTEPLRSCGPNVRDVATNVDVARARLRAARLSRRIVVRGSFTRQEELGGPAFGSGSLSTRVSWTLTLTRAAPAS